jgi:hypothetical protein
MFRSERWAVLPSGGGIRRTESGRKLLCIEHLDLDLLHSWIAQFVTLSSTALSLLSNKTQKKRPYPRKNLERTISG